MNGAGIRVVACMVDPGCGLGLFWLVILLVGVQGCC